MNWTRCTDYSKCNIINNLLLIYDILFVITCFQTLLPSPCTAKDGNQLLLKLYGKEDQFFIAGTVVAHQEFLKSCVDIFKTSLQEKAKKVNK